MVASHAGPSPRADALVDEHVLDDLVDMLGERSEVEELVGMLVDSLPERLAAMLAAHEAGAAEELQLQAHRLKAASRQLGAGALADVAARVEALEADCVELEPLVEPTRQAWCRWRDEGPTG